MKALKFAVTLFVLLCLETSAIRRIPAFAGSYRLIFNHIGNVSEDFNSTGKGWFQMHTTQVRGKQLQYGWGQAYVSEPFTDDMKVTVTMSSRSNNQWKRNAFLMKFDRVCTNARVHGQSILDEFYGPDYDTSCPIKPFGLKEIRNHSFEIKFPQAPVMPYGRYLVNFAVHRGTKTLCVFVADIDIVPRL